MSNRSKLAWGGGVLLVLAVLVGGAMFRDKLMGTADNDKTKTNDPPAPVASNTETGNPPADTAATTSATATPPDATAVADAEPTDNTSTRDSTRQPPAPPVGFRRLTDDERLTLARLRELAPNATRGDLNELFTVIPQLCVAPTNETDLVEFHYTVNFEKARALGLNAEAINALNALRVPRARYQWHDALAPTTGTSLYNLSSIRIVFPDDGIATFAVDAGKTENAPLIRNRTTGHFYGIPTN